MRQLKNKVVLVTGGSRGIGAEIARAFGRQGARIAIAARSEDELERARKELESAGVTAVAVAADVGHVDSLRRLVAEVERQLGPVDVLVNNAAAGETILEFERVALDDVEKTFRVNAVGTMWLTQLVLPSMIERGEGHIVNMSSNAGLLGVPFNALYSATKHAIVGFSRSLRGELEEKNVGVSVICPTFVTGERIEHNFDGRKPPKQAGTVTERQVADAVVNAVLENKGEVVVNKGIGKISDVAQAIAPGFTFKMYKRTGVFDYFKQAAKANAERVND
jgi:short-subunit dehydrogenase